MTRMLEPKAVSVDTSFLNGIRFLLAVWVAVGHYYLVLGGNKFISSKWLSVLPANGLAVEGFMLLSGFLITYNYLRHPEQARSFYIRRFFRVYPVYLLALLLTLASTPLASRVDLSTLRMFTGGVVDHWGVVHTAAHPASAGDIVSHVLLLNGLFPQWSGSLLGPAWSLSLEVQFYLIFPLIVRALEVTGFRFAIFCLGITALGFASVQVFGLSVHVGYLCTFPFPSMIFYRLPVFVLGMLAATTVLNKTRALYLIVSFAIILPFHHQVIPFIVIGGVLLFTKQMQTIKRLLSGRVATWGAEISYSLYLMHLAFLAFVLNICLRWPMGKIPLSIAIFLLWIVACFVLCTAIYKCIEKPAIKIGKQWAQSSPSS